MYTYFMRLKKIVSRKSGKVRKSRTVAARLTPEVAARLTEMAAESRRSVGNFLRLQIEDLVNHPDPPVLREPGRA